MNRKQSQGCPVRYHVISTTDPVIYNDVTLNSAISATFRIESQQQQTTNILYPLSDYLYPFNCPRYSDISSKMPLYERTEPEKQKVLIIGAGAAGMVINIHIAFSPPHEELVLLDSRCKSKAQFYHNALNYWTESISDNLSFILVLRRSALAAAGQIPCHDYGAKQCRRRTCHNAFRG
jgi:hypothetical protein